MIFFFLIYVIQLCFLPGYLALKNITLKFTSLEKIILSFGISVFLNYLLYWVLYFSHLYSKKSILWVFFIELIILVWYEKNNVRSLTKKNVIDICKTKILLLFKNIQVTVGNRYKYGVFLFFLNLGTIISLGLFLIYSFGSIFLSNDDFIHWIEWARSWANLSIPENFRQYPQLMPIIWSYSFLFSDGLEFMAKSIMPLFIIIYCFIFLHLGIIFKKSYWFLAGPVSIVFVMNTYLRFYSGYVDFTCALFCLLSVYVILIAHKHNESNTKLVIYFCFAGIFSISSGLTKQAGYFYMVAFPFVSYFFLRGNGLKLKHIIWYVFLSLLVVTPLNLYQIYLINIGENTSNLKLVMHDIYHGKNAFERVLQAAAKFIQYTLLGLYNIDGITYNDINSPWLIIHKFFLLYPIRLLILLFGPFLLILTIIKGLNNIYSRTLFFYVALPYGLIWSLFFPYSIRNISIALPFLGLTVGSGLDNILLNNKWWVNIRKITVFHLLFCIGLIAVTLNAFYTHKKLTAIQETMVLKRGFERLNNKLLQYHEFIGFDQNNKILSGYEGLNYIPGLNKVTISQAFGKYEGERYALKTYHDNLKNNNITYILFPRDTEMYSKSIYDDINRKVNAGAYKLVFSENDFDLIMIKK